MELADRVRSRHVWQLAWPNIVSTLMLTSIGLAHIKIVSPYGADAVAAVSSGHRVFFLLQALLIGMSAATTALVARHWGSGDRSRAAEATRSSLNMAIGIAIAAGVAFFLGAHIIAAAFGLEPAPAALATAFIRITAAFNIVHAVSMILSTGIRSTGDVKTPMRYSMVSTVLNIGFCFVLVNGLAVFPEMGTSGAAMAGGLAPLIVYGMMALKWYRGGFDLPFARHGGKDYRTLITIGTPAAIEQCIIQGSLMAFMVLVGHYGTEAFAAYGLGITLLSAVIVVGYGFSIAGATLVAQYLGAGNKQQARHSALRTMKLSLLAMSLLGALCFVFARELSEFMVSDPAVVDKSVQFIWIMALVMPLMAIEVSLAGALRGAGDTRTPLVATFAGLSTRLAGGLVVVLLDGPVSTLYAMLFADYVVKVAINVRRYRSGHWLDGPAPRR